MTNSSMYQLCRIPLFFLCHLSQIFFTEKCDDIFYHLFISIYREARSQPVSIRSFIILGQGISITSIPELQVVCCGRCVRHHIEISEFACIPIFRLVQIAIHQARQGKPANELVFMGEKLRGEKDYRFIAAEPASCPSFTRGKYLYDFCDTGNVCPLAKMYTLGNGFMPAPNHAGGLRFHGMSTILSEIYDQRLMDARAYEQTEVFDAAVTFARAEGILPAPESSHAIRAAIDEAMLCKESGEEKTILFGLSGTGYFDLKAYEQYNDGTMTDYIPTDADLERGFAYIPPQPEE